MKSIKQRVLRSFLFIVILSIVMLDILLMVAVKSYYYENSEKLLTNQMTTATTFYNKYFAATSLQENIYDNVDAFWNQTDAQVQVYDKHGNLIMDSIGVNERSKEYSDVEKALKGEVARWTGNVDYYNSTVMSVSSPIVVEDSIIGVLRYIVSLENVNKEVLNISSAFIVISIIVFLIGFVLSLILAKSIINPITDLTRVANEMASGNLMVRSISNEEDEVGKLAKTLNFMAEELSIKDRLKDDFISSVSHELRTPLTAIKGWVITLQHDTTDKETLNLGLKIIEKESDRLGNMVEELLDFSRLQNGKINLNKKSVNLKNFINYIELYMSQRAMRENKKLKVTMDVEVENIYFDQDRMKQVLINLIDNAFRFTEENEVIELKVFQDENKIILNVIDNGCGISEVDLPRVKEKFYKGKNIKSQNGIGLSICDEIIKLHEGILSIESKEGFGTKIIVEIPIIVG